MTAERIKVFRRVFPHGMWPRGASRGLVVSMTVLLVLVAMAVAVPIVSPYSPVRTDLPAASLSPSGSHWFGTDANGMDIFTRVFAAARTDLSLAVLGILTAVVIGAFLGSFAAWFGGWVDEALSRAVEVFQAIPVFLFALMVVAAFGNSRTVLWGLLAVSYVPTFYKIARSLAAPVLVTDFVAVARTAGLSGPRIVVSHVLPNIIRPVFSQVAVNMGFAIQVIAGLSFLGLGIAIPEPEWGAMIAQGAERVVYGEWWMALFPGLAVFVAVIALDGLGARLMRAESR